MWVSLQATLLVQCLSAFAHVKNHQKRENVETKQYGRIPNTQTYYRIVPDSHDFCGFDSDCEFYAHKFLPHTWLYARARFMNDKTYSAKFLLCLIHKNFVRQNCCAIYTVICILATAHSTWILIHTCTTWFYASKIQFWKFCGTWTSSMQVRRWIREVWLQLWTGYTH